MNAMPRLFSYVVEHDHGHSPNPTGGFCTLAFCKFEPIGGHSIVSAAQKGDWVIGTGGASRKSAGHGRLVYAMKVTEKLTLADYFPDSRFANRAGNNHYYEGRTDMFALVSNHFYYFGSKAPKLAKRHAEHPEHPIECGRGYRSRFDEDFIADFVAWLEERYDPGLLGTPCDPVDGEWDDFDPYRMLLRRWHLKPEQPLAVREAHEKLIERCFYPAIPPVRADGYWAHSSDLSTPYTVGGGAREGTVHPSGHPVRRCGLRRH